jgi:hypothetical protein
VAECGRGPLPSAGFTVAGHRRAHSQRRRAGCGTQLRRRTCTIPWRAPTRAAGHQRALPDGGYDCLRSSFDDRSGPTPSSDRAMLRSAPGAGRVHRAARRGPGNTRHRRSQPAPCQHARRGAQRLARPAASSPPTIPRPKRAVVRRVAVPPTASGRQMPAARRPADARVVLSFRPRTRESVPGFHYARRRSGSYAGHSGS